MKLTNIEQNKNYSVMSFFLSVRYIFLSVFSFVLPFLFLFFVHPAFAVDPVELSSEATPAVQYQTPSSSASYINYYRVYSNSDPVYMINYNWVVDGVVGDGQIHYGTMLFSRSQFTSSYSYGTDTNSYVSSYDSVNDYYYDVYGYTVKSDTRLDVLAETVYCATRADADSYAVSYLSGLSGSSLNYSLPPGNVAFIGVGSNFSFSLDTQFIESTGLFSGLFSKTSQTWGWSNSIITSGSFPLSGHVLIPWAKGENTNLLGQSHFGHVSSTSLFGSGSYFVLYNPLYSYQNDSENNFEHNFNVNISASGVISLTVVSLKGNLASGIESSWTLTSTPDGETYQATIDENGVPSFTDSQGNSSAPIYGGDNYIENSTQNFKGWLNSIIHTFLGVFETGRDAILTLVSQGQAFISTLPQLYSWLPPPVYSVLVSALILVLAIGLIKVLL